MPDHMLDGEETPPKTSWDIPLSESKLRSCLEGLDSVPAAQSLAQSVAQSIVIPRTPYSSTPTKVSSGKREAGDVSSKEGGSRGGSASSRKKNLDAQEARRPKGPAPVNSLSSNSQDGMKDVKVRLYLYSIIVLYYLLYPYCVECMTTQQYYHVGSFSVYEQTHLKIKR